MSSSCISFSEDKVPIIRFFIVVVTLLHNGGLEEDGLLDMLPVETLV